MMPHRFTGERTLMRIFIDGGLVTLEKVRVILYRPHDVPESERWQHRIEGLEPEGDPKT